MSYIGNAPTSVAFLTNQFSGTGSQTVFTMSVAPASTGSILVCVTGVTQDPSTYSISGTTLTFSQAPPSGTGNISVRYLGIPASNIATTAYRTVTDFTATLAQTIFTVPSYTVGYINVYRNGVRLGVADYTATNGTTVVLTIGASTGDLVTTESFYVSSVLNAIPAVAGAVTSSYILDGAVGTAEIASGVTLTAPNISTITNGIATLTLPVTTDTLVGKATTDVLTNKTLTTPTIDSAQVPTVSGTAPLYMCRAWVNFNGTGVVAIRASGNVSSITDNGVGDYTVNFTTAMSDANYAPVTMAVMDGTQFSGAGYYSTYITYKANTRLVGSVGFLTGYSNQATTSSKVDCADIAVAVFR